MYIFSLYQSIVLHIYLGPAVEFCWPTSWCQTPAVGGPSSVPAGPEISVRPGARTVWWNSWWNLSPSNHLHIYQKQGYEKLLASALLNFHTYTVAMYILCMHCMKINPYSARFVWKWIQPLPNLKPLPFSIFITKDQIRNRKSLWLPKRIETISYIVYNLRQF